MIPKVEYLGHCISADEIHPILEKVRAVQEVLATTDVSQLQLFLGTIRKVSPKFPHTAAFPPQLAPDS